MTSTTRPNLVGLSALLLCLGPICASPRTYEIQPATAADDEEFERVANALKPGDLLILHGGTYSQTGRRSVTAKGTLEQPIVIRAAPGPAPLLTRPPEDRDRQNNIEFVDCAHLVIRGLRFQGGSSGVRFIRGHHVTLEGCEIFETGNNALTMNSGDCHAFVIRSNHLQHTRVTDVGLVHLAGLTSLTNVRLSGPGITDHSVEHLLKLQSLRELWLLESGLTDAGVARLAGLPRLEQLLLNNAPITDRSLTTFRDMPQLPVVFVWLIDLASPNTPPAVGAQRLKCS